MNKPPELIEGLPTIYVPGRGERVDFGKFVVPGEGRKILLSSEFEKIAIKHPLSRKIRPVGFELLQRAKGFEELYKNIRQELVEGDGKPQVVVLVGFTGAGKRTFATQFAALASTDPLCQEIGLQLKYVSFAECANAMPLEGVFESPGLGKFEPWQYRLTTKRMSGFVFEQLDEYGKPTLVLVEASAPTAYREETGIEGSDRGYGTMVQLAEKYNDHTNVVVIRRDEGVLRAILEFRKGLLKATPKNVVDLFKRSNVSVFGDRTIEDIEGYTVDQKRELITELVESCAPPSTVLKNAEQMQARMRILADQGEIESESDEVGFWSYLLYKDLKFDPEKCLVVFNKFGEAGVTIHEKIIGRIDPVRRHNQILKMKQDYSGLGYVRTSYFISEKEKMMAHGVEAQEGEGKGQTIPLSYTQTP